MSNNYEDAGPLDANQIQGPPTPQEVTHTNPNLERIASRPDVMQDEYDHPEDFTGLFVLFNQISFGSEDSERKGSEKDGTDLVDCLTRLRYEVRKEFIFKDKSKAIVEEELKKIAGMDHSKRSSLIIVFLTHGNEGGILYCSDGQYITCQEVWSYFTEDKCPKLKGKPKIFIFQACKGVETSKGEQIVQCDSLSKEEMAKNVYIIPEDALVAYSTFEGNVSYRDPLMGTWFIQELCKNFTAYGRRDDILTLFTRISKCVSHHYQTAYIKINKESKEKEKVYCKQMPCFISTLTKKFYLCKSNERRFILELCEKNKVMLDILQKLKNNIVEQ